jgi:hypothetical protein
VYLFCLFLAVFFWLLNALGNIYSTNVVFNVTYLNHPKKQVILNDLPSTLNINIKGLGFDLMGYKLKFNQPVIDIDLAAIEKNRINNKSLFSKSVATNSFFTKISSQLGQHIEIKGITPDSIRFLIDEKAEKILPIIPEIDITYSQQYQLFGKIIVKPSVVKVVGAKSVLDTLTKVFTEKITLKNLSESTNEAVSYDVRYDKLKLNFNPQKAILYVPVEKFTETTRSIKINTINVPDSIDLKTIPKEIEIKFQLPLSKIASLESAIFFANVDFNTIDKDFTRKLKVNLVNYPSYIKAIVISPSKVEYIIKKKHD